MSTPVVQLAGLQTENRNSRTTAIDRVPTLELCRILNREDRDVPAAVEPCIPVIADVIDALSERVRRGGRVFYIGAGTSGRLGVLDASEIPPTYSAPAGQFIALIAGGDYALRHAKEGAEDDRSAASVDLGAFNLDPEVDSLIGIASSGRTPYVLGGLAFMKALGATTVALVCVSPSAAREEGNADFVIEAVTGPEAVTGSTRMKAGTATKLVLNMISTGIMVKLGKTYGNLMIDVKATNIKLKQRARNILRFVGGAACTQTDLELDTILESCRGSVKLAAVTIVLKVSVAEAEERLQRNKGVLARVFEEAAAAAAEKETSSQLENQVDGSNDLVLCVDAGGTSCKAVVLSKDGEMGTVVAGPCNVTNIGVDAAMSTISKAVQEALDNCKTTKGRQLGSVKFEAAWVGMAGYGRPSLSSAIDSAISELLDLPLGSPRLRITTDIDILPSSVFVTPTTVTDQGNSNLDPDLDSVIVLVAGTGSIAMRYARNGDAFQRTHRVGGWGYLLGDDGSGYGIGREALRVALQSADLNRLRTRSASAAQQQQKSTTNDSSLLSEAIFNHFRTLYPDSSKPEDLLSMVLAPTTNSDNKTEDATLATTKRIAGVAEVVISLAAAAASDTSAFSGADEASRIVDAGVASLVDLVSSLLLSETESGAVVDPTRSGLVLAGGLMKSDFYKAKLLKMLEERCGGRFERVETVHQPAVAGARFLLGRI